MCKSIEKSIAVKSIAVVVYCILVFIAILFYNNAIRDFFSFTLVMSIALLGPSLFFILIANILSNIIKKEKNIKRIIKIKKASERFFVWLVIIIFTSALLSGI